MRERFQSVSLAFVVLMAVAPLRAVQDPAASSDPQAVIRRVITRELQSTSGGPPYWAYRLHRETPTGSQTREMVQTKDGIVARYVAVNGRPLTEKQRREEEKRLANLLSNPEEQARKAREQKEEAERVRKMLRAMPDAFHFTYEGTETGKYGQLARYKFRPNPAFRSSARETLVFRAMNGTMWIDTDEQRLARIDATLFDDVTLGWGFVARLKKGGRFELEQSRLPEGAWMLTRMVLDFEGKALLFKNINIRQKQTISNYQQVPATLTLSQGVELLKKRES